MLGAVGVVYGDIGTSPLYTIKQSFAGTHPLALDPAHIYGVLSLVFWAVMVIVSLKYATFMMRADNRGEGGSLSLLARVSGVVQSKRFSALVVVLGVFAAALFYGDSMITPAVSVFSAVEGLEVIAPGLHQWVEPVTLAILVLLFGIQRYGTAIVGRLFGPVMVLWFVTLAATGLYHVGANPGILAALDPRHAIRFFMLEEWIAFLALGSVVLAVTGAEALFTDMGHFGRRPIRAAWFFLVLPALMLNYFGQGALLLAHPEAIQNPFFHLVPAAGVPWLVVLATAAAVIASQAVISGTFSVTRQAIQLGFLPRMQIVHTSAGQIGQIYIPFINWTVMIFVAALVLGFDSSSNLAAAYGVAVTGTMLIDTLLLSIMVFAIWRWNIVVATLTMGTLFIVDLSFFASNLTKVTQGGWFPLVIGVIAFVLLTTWKSGRALLFKRIADDTIPVKAFIESTSDVQRVPGTGVFMTGSIDIVPHAMLHNLKHNKVIHERVVLLTVLTEQVPRVGLEDRVKVEHLGNGFHRLSAHFGFLEDPDVPNALALAKRHGLEFNTMSTSFFLSRETLIARGLPGMALWREHLFAWMSRNATSARDFFRIPPNRVVELGSQIEI